MRFARFAAQCFACQSSLRLQWLLAATSKIASVTSCNTGYRNDGGFSTSLVGFTALRGRTLSGTRCRNWSRAQLQLRDPSSFATLHSPVDATMLHERLC